MLTSRWKVFRAWPTLHITACHFAVCCFEGGGGGKAPNTKAAKSLALCCLLLCSPRGGGGGGGEAPNTKAPNQSSKSKVALWCLALYPPPPPSQGGRQQSSRFWAKFWTSYLGFPSQRSFLRKTNERLFYTRPDDGITVYFVHAKKPYCYGNKNTESNLRIYFQLAHPDKKTDIHEARSVKNELA